MDMLDKCRICGTRDGFKKEPTLCQACYIKKVEKKSSEYFERSKAKTNEIVLLKRKLSDNTETINTERMKVDMLERKLEIAVTALTHLSRIGYALSYSIIAENALEKLKELK